MKSATLTPNSSTKSPLSMDTETRDSSYFPGCKKNANCNCEICIASINATLDLIPQSINRRTPLSSFDTKPVIPPRSPVPVSFPDPSPSDLYTPTPCSKAAPIRPVSVSPVKRRDKGLGFGVGIVRLVLGLGLVLGFEFGFCGVFLRPRFSRDVVKGFGERSRGFGSLSTRFVFLRNELEGFLVKGNVSSCGSVASLWKINQDGLLLNSKCVLYESMAEEVSIWGWPLQASGLLTAEYSSRSFTILSGRVSEWSNGEAKYFVRETNSSWTQTKWSSSVVQLDPNTWILEYRQSFLVENARLLSAVAEFLKFRIRRHFEKMKQEFWSPQSFGSQYFDFIRERSIPLPT